MSRLQRLDGPSTYVLSLSAAGRIHGDQVIARMVYEHPIYTPESVAAQKGLPGNQRRSCRLRRRPSQLGISRGRRPIGPRSSALAGSGLVTALYDAVVTHARQEPVASRFRCRTYYWLVDLDRLPRMPRLLRPFARFEARDHLR